MKNLIKLVTVLFWVLILSLVSVFADNLSVVQKVEKLKNDLVNSPYSLQSNPWSSKSISYLIKYNNNLVWSLYWDSNQLVVIPGWQNANEITADFDLANKDYPFLIACFVKYSSQINPIVNTWTVVNTGVLINTWAMVNTGTVISTGVTNIDNDAQSKIKEKVLKKEKELQVMINRLAKFTTQNLKNLSKQVDKRIIQINNSEIVQNSKEFLIEQLQNLKEAIKKVLLQRWINY